MPSKWRMHREIIISEKEMTQLGNGGSIDWRARSIEAIQRCRRKRRRWRKMRRALRAAYELKWAGACFVAGVSRLSTRHRNGGEKRRGIGGAAMAAASLLRDGIGPNKAAKAHHIANGVS